jgi:hypothetical protein
MVVGGYRLSRPLGKGGMGVVYQATQLSLDREVALKLVAPGLSGDLEFRTRFRREGLIQARIEHPNIVTVYEAGEHDGTLFLAMQLVRGSSLKQMITARELDARRTLRILGAVADALDSAHAKGVIHRDVKPQNILVGSGDRAYLADFGITKLLDATAITREGNFIGTRDYVSPEQVQGERVTPASDIYSLGVVLFECLTGVVPYRKDNELAVLYAHANEPQPKVSQYRRDLPVGLDGVIERAMGKTSQERPESAVRLIREAEEALNGATGTGASAGEDAARDEATSIRDAAAPTPAATKAAPDAATRVAPGISLVWSRARRWPGSLLSAGLAVLLASGFAVGHFASGSAASSAPRVVAAGHLSLDVPAAWGRQAGRVSLPGLTFEHGVAFENDTSGGMLVAGLVDGANGATLIPPSFLSQLSRVPAPTDRVRMGVAQAYRYRGLELSTVHRPLTLLLAPTSVGVIGIACMAPSNRARSFLVACEGTSDSLHLLGATPLELGPSLSYGRTLGAVVARLYEAQSTSEELARARTRAGQSALCRRLAQAYSAAATTLAGAKPGPDVASFNATLLGALRDVAAEYQTMSHAGNVGDHGRYERARAAVGVHLSGLRRDFAALRAAGYGS